MAEMTPMMRQYRQIKEQNPDCILFFRLGDFYEMFDEDARTASRELDLTLTTRDRSKDKDDETRVPMCGVPYHSSEAYIARLIARGYKVAICDQMEDPALAKGLVKREVTRLVTPGAVTESSMLEESKNNYYACVFAENGSFGVSFCDISTGALCATCFDGATAEEAVCSELGAFSPAEVLLGGEALHAELLKTTLRERKYFRFAFHHEIFGEDGRNIAVGDVCSVLVNREMRPVNMAKALPEAYEAYGRYLESAEASK